MEYFKTYNYNGTSILIDRYQKTKGGKFYYTATISVEHKSMHIKTNEFNAKDFDDALEKAVKYIIHLHGLMTA